jgi:Sulfotransferase domain
VRFLVSTTQRCGSTWLTNILEASLDSKPTRYLDCAAFGFSLDRPNNEMAIQRLATTLDARGEYPVFKTHDVPSKDFDRLCSTIPDLKILTIHRDFKDVVISRYFYYRYYWPTEPSLGVLGEPIAQFVDDVSALSDEDAISCLVNSPILATWVSEWKAFEGEFSTPNAMRLRYSEMLSGENLCELETFIGSPIRKCDSFEQQQEAETSLTGREGKSRFFRQGRSGQWKDLLTPEDVVTIDRLITKP